jgi:hypothetical protein
VDRFHYYAVHMDSNHTPNEGLRETALLELEVDLRISELLLEAWGERDWDERLIGRYLRLAYAAGYLDSLREPRRGELCLRHGFPVPKRRRD